MLTFTYKLKLRVGVEVYIARGKYVRVKASDDPGEMYAIYGATAVDCFVESVTQSLRDGQGLIKTPLGGVCCNSANMGKLAKKLATKPRYRVPPAKRSFPFYRHHESTLDYVRRYYELNSDTCNFVGHDTPTIGFDAMPDRPSPMEEPEES